MIKEIVRAPKFIQQTSKIDKSQLDRLKKLIVKIIQNPEIGKPMRFDRKGTREVYAGSFRLSYSYDKKQDILYLLEIYHKDKQ